MDASERALLETTVRDAIAGVSPVDVVLTELGWLDMLATEPRDAIDVVFTALGAANATSSALDDVIAAGLGLQPRADVAVLLPPFGTWDAPGPAQGLAGPRAARATEFLVAGRDGVFTVPMADVGIHPVHGLDPDAGLHTVQITRGTPDASPLDEGAWTSAVALGRRALAHQIAGASRAMLDLARVHAVERVQFGRPIARFQAVRHRLAEALVAVEALDAALTAAADEPDPTTAALAKALAGRTARTVASHCQQVLAGIGFTTEHPFHRFMKRTMVLDGLLGSADTVTADLGRGLLTVGAVPTLIEL